MNTGVKSLKRSLKRFGVLLITLSAISPTASVFIIAPGAIQQAGTGAFLSFLAAAVVCVFMAFIYAELSSAYPLTGGEYAMVGRILGRLPGTIILGVNLITVVLIGAVMARGLVTYVVPVFPNVSPIQLSLFNVAIATCFALLNIRIGALVTGIFLGVEIIVLLALTYLGIHHATHSVSEFVLHPVHLNSSGTVAPSPVGLIGLATAVAIFSYNGYGQAVYFGEETEDAPKRIARIIFGALAITIITEAVPVTAFLMGTANSGAVSGAGDNMITDFVTASGGKRFNAILCLGVAAAILNACIAGFLLAARQFFSSGRDRVWPGGISRALARIHSRFNSPWVATLLVGVLVGACCFLSLNFLVVASGTGLIVIYAALCIAVIHGRRTGSTSHSHYRMPWYPLPPLIGLLALVYVGYANYLDEVIGRRSLAATAVIVIVSAGYYFLVLRRREGWVFRGPEE